MPSTVDMYDSLYNVSYKQNTKPNTKRIGTPDLYSLLLVFYICTYIPYVQSFFVFFFFFKKFVDTLHDIV